ncbi:hypothetical protein ACWEQL_12475 [Kitasatospora sp. NPDC004240]
MPWEDSRPPQLGQDLFTTSCQLTDEERETIRTVLTEVKLRAVGKPRLLVSIAVGAGDPETAWMNPSVDVDPAVLARQSSPGYFTDAAKNGYFVISIVLNNSGFPADQKVRVLNESESLFQVQASARFPLNDGPTTATWQELTELAALVKKAKGLWVVTNCLTDLHYQPITDLVAKGPAGSSAYLHSYALKGHTVERAYNRFGPAWRSSTGRFERLGDVFETLDDE